MTDVAVIGGGIAGCATAAFLAEAGATVTLYERETIAAGASGRNSGVAPAPDGPAARAAPRGVAGAVRRARPRLRLPGRADRHPRRGRRPHGADRPISTPCGRASRRSLPSGWRARRCRLPSRASRPTCAPTGSPPAARCRRPPPRARGPTGRAPPEPASSRARRRCSRAATGASRACAPAGGWTRPKPWWSRPARGRRRRSAPRRPWRPVVALWGVVAQVRLAAPPRHTVEQAGVESLTEPGGAPASLFSVVTADGVSAVGSTFTPDEPDAAAIAPQLLERGARLRARAARRERSSTCARAPGRCRPTAGRCSGRSRASRDCTWSPATARGASASGRARRGWWRTV